MLGKQIIKNNARKLKQGRDKDDRKTGKKIAGHRGGGRYRPGYSYRRRSCWNRLPKRCACLIVPIWARLAAHEEIIYCELTDRDAVEALVAGCEGIIHLGGQSVEADWQTVRDSNIEGLYNLYEAARIHQVKRILFASSIM